MYIYIVRERERKREKDIERDDGQSTTTVATTRSDLSLETRVTWRDDGESFASSKGATDRKRAPVYTHTHTTHIHIIHKNFVYYIYYYMLCRLCVCIRILLYDILFRDHTNSCVKNVYFRRFPI